MDITDYLKRQKFVMVALKGLLSKDQAAFCNNYVDEAMTDGNDSGSEGERTKVSKTTNQQKGGSRVQPVHNNVTG
jgi:hypothetical protein